MVEQLSLDRRASALMAGWNVTSMIQGTGTLGIPYSVRMGGWAGITTILILAWVCCFTGKLLIECLYSESKSTGKIKRVYTNYPELGGAVWPKFGNHLVSVIQVCEMFGGTIMYIVLLATLVTDLFTTCTPLRQQHWAVICTYIALPLAFVRRVSVIAWASMISVFAFTCALTTIIIYTITQYHHMSIQNIPAFDFTKFPVGFGIIVFSYTAHAVFPGVEASMRNPRMYPRMMNVAFVVAAIVKTSLGLLTVMVFGTTTQQAVTVNIKNSTVVNYLSNGFVIINVLFSFPINLFVITETLDSKFLRFFPHMDRSSEYNWAWQGLTRTLVLTLALVLVLIVPHFALFVGFVGSFTGTCLCFVLPCYFNIKLKWQSLRWFVSWYDARYSVESELITIKEAPGACLDETRLQYIVQAVSGAREAHPVRSRAELTRVERNPDREEPIVNGNSPIRDQNQQQDKSPVSPDAESKDADQEESEEEDEDNSEEQRQPSPESSQNGGEENQGRDKQRPDRQGGKERGQNKTDNKGPKAQKANKGTKGPKGSPPDAKTLRARAQKEKHKGQRANHNRKAGAEWKRNKGMGALPPQ
ncbi:predicted protein [Nematostella vectensis]|uniref:Amino acid transporter transmembrane domain-containing protein n=1 Tax=Nematostella vectensis TaxID=45351 RepID=A7T4V5_NEMVE|nr:predicted protein [Nematostella vectensis]|eukprot:XP_001621106.1 hypothetical protein NEMVEDRAFT_v1g222356 [Nematostella vectensis]